MEDTLLYAAIDLASDVLSRSLRELKQRDIKNGVHAHHLAGVSSAEALELLQLEADEPEMDDALRQAAEIPATVIRRKLFSVATVSASEAVEKMEDLGHDFYLFKDSASGVFSVVYKRKTGGYGLLVPKNV